MEKIERCDQLIRVLENPEVDEGALIWGADNGWTVGRNALVMRDELLIEGSNLLDSDTARDTVVELENVFEDGE